MYSEPEGSRASNTPHKSKIFPSAIRLCFHVFFNPALNICDGVGIKDIEHIYKESESKLLPEHEEFLQSHIQVVLARQSVRSCWFSIDADIWRKKSNCITIDISWDSYSLCIRLPTEELVEQAQGDLAW